MALVRRRDVLRAGLAVPALALTQAAAARRRADPRVVVVGAGLAGLTAAYRIHRATGWQVSVHEASTRVGGRAYTIRGLPGGLHAEAGGTFISTGDWSIRGLAKDLDVRLLDLDPLWPGGGYAYFFDSRRRRGGDVFRGEWKTARVAERQFRTIPWQITHGENDPQAVRLDRMTVAEWIASATPEKASIFRSYLRTYFETDYTGPAGEASALQMLADFAAPGRSYDERFLVRRGTDTLATTLVDRLPDGAVRLGSALVAVHERAHGYRLTFDDGGITEDVHADAVILALPFPALRRVDLTTSGFSRLKRRAIRELGMGVGMKANLVFESAAWRPESSGESVSDLAPGWTWPGHVGQESDKRLMVCMTGAGAMPDTTGAPVHGVAPPALADAYLTDLDRIFPGCAAAYAGTTWVARWVEDPWAGGTYSYYRSGTMTEIAGAERRTERTAFFAGEHTARYGNRATLNGAVWSGDQAARGVVATLRSG